jgi:ribosomal protein S18 acetylase RimI-like enzyme
VSRLAAGTVYIGGMAEGGGGATGVATDIEVRPLGPDTIEDFFAFFANKAFVDNPHWSGCVCMFYHANEEPWDAGPEMKVRHIAAKREHILAGKSRGHLAYINGEPVGWVNAAPRESYENPRTFRAAHDGTPGVGAVMCFVVHPAQRGRGVATALLNAACEGFRRQGLRYAEGYARISEKSADWETFATMNYHGPLSMYEQAGFEKVGEIPHYAVMRKAL